MPIIRHNVLKRSYNYARIRTKIPFTMSLQTVKAALAAECKKRTAVYFGKVNPVLPEASAKAKAAARIITESNFGCATKDVAALVSVLIGENVTHLVKPLNRRPEPDPGVVVFFLSARIAPGQWIPEVTISKDGDTTRYVNNYEEGATSGLSQDQLDQARPPTDSEIDALFEKMPIGNLRVVLGSQFGVDVMVHGE